MFKLSKIIMYNRHDRDAIIVLMLIIITSIVVFPLLCDKDTKQQNKPSYRQSGGKRAIYYDVPNEGKSEGELFPFDPNTADSTQLLRLGLKPWQVRSIYKYRAKGGRYRKPTDFARLYGLTLQQYKRLEPYITITPEPMARDYYAKEQSENTEHTGISMHHQGSPDSPENHGMQEKSGNPTPTYERIAKLQQGEKIDINSADTTMLKRIPGIGSYFARRIVELRQRRGMFISPEQLLTIRNFPETALTYMTASQDFPVIRINHATLKELHAHPLLNYTQANDIIQLRRTSGTIRSAQDLAFIPSISPDLLKRLIPLLSFE